MTVSPASPAALGQVGRFFLDSENPNCNQINILSDYDFEILANFSPNSSILQSYYTAWTQSGHKALWPIGIALGPLIC